MPISSTLFGRLQAALTPTYIVEREVAQGGMSVVFLARDTALQRAVAIKVIRPEFATARLVERFRHEARLLANLNHPRIVPVYAAGEADGLVYFVMPFIAGETLADRLKRAPLAAHEAKRVVLDVLDALSAAHAIGVVHRDVTARNVFLVKDRALLADFGIATSAATASSADVLTGTPGAMPPEQARGEDVSPATDVYAVGALLYAAIAGRSWTMTAEPDPAAWRGVPTDFARALRGALKWTPADRYPNAAAFAAALKRRRLWPGLVAMAATVALIFAGWRVFRDPETVPENHLAVLPFEVTGNAASTIGHDLAGLVTFTLQGVPELQLTNKNFAFRWSDEQARAVQPTNRQPLHAKFYVVGNIVQANHRLTVAINVFKGDRPFANFSLGNSADSLPALSDSIALELLRRVHPRLVAKFGGSTPVSTRNVTALQQFLIGERAFDQGAWLAADQHYSAAVASDSTFLFAWWRLLNVWRWMPTVVPNPQLDLASLYRRYGASLPEVDRLLVEAELATAGRERLRKLEHATSRFPHHDNAALLYGVELWHRGPLSGVPLATALAALERAGALNQYLAPAQENIAWAAIRLGDAERARNALAKLATIAAPPDAVDVYTPAFFQQAYFARFDSTHAKPTLLQFFDNKTSDGLDRLRFGVRAGLMVALPQTQRTLARRLLAAPNATTVDRANAYEALALAELAQGFNADGFAHLDSAALTLRTPEAELEIAEWHTLAPLLGWPIVPRELERDGRALLMRLAQHPATATRASWALAIADIAVSRAGSADLAIERFRSMHRDEAGMRLADLLDALSAASKGDYEKALRISERSLPYDSHARHGDPFARALLHLQRAEWRLKLGDREGADSELLWADNIDVVGWPSGPAQSAEVDWVFTAYALMRRADLARVRGDAPAACARLQEAKYFLNGAPFPLAVNQAGCAT